MSCVGFEHAKRRWRVCSVSSVLLYLLLVQPSVGSIRVLTDGVRPLEKDDVALVLYITVINEAHVPADVSIVVRKCCLWEDTDCKIINMLTSYLKDLQSSKMANLTAIYPTMYPFNLVGKCDVDIHSSELGQVSSVHHTITFNTSISIDSTTNWMPKVIKDYLFGITYEKCEGRDEDPLSLCQPVDCVLKYHGQRNHYSHELMHCIPTTTCVDYLDDRRPVLFLDDHNECHKLSMHLEEDDLALFSNSKRQNLFQPINWKEKVHYNCNHGSMRNDNNGCECDDGWVTSKGSDRILSFDGLRFRQCNVWSPREHWLMNVYIVLISVVSLCCLLSLLLIIVYLCQKYTPQKHSQLDETAMEVELIQKDIFFEKLHREMKPSTSLAEEATPSTYREGDSLFSVDSVSSSEDELDADTSSY